MKILYHHRTQSKDAQGIHITEMVNAFRELGHETEIVALVRNEKADQVTSTLNVWGWLKQRAPGRVYAIMSLSYNIYGYGLLCRAIRLNKPNLIYERYSLNTFCGIWASRRFRLPLVLEVNAPLCYEEDRLGGLKLKRLARYLERWICSRATMTVVVSAAMRELLLREGVPAEKMVVIPNGVDPKKFNPSVSGDTVKRQLGLEQNIVIGFVGWFREWHGLDKLLQIVSEARLNKKRVKLLLVGDGPTYLELYRYAETHQLLSSVIFTGPVRRQEIPFHIAAMDIAVVPRATAYACPMKVVEYMAMGKCIVAPDQANIRELLEDGVSGYLFRPDDAKHFHAVLMQAIQNPERRKSFGTKAFETLLERKYLWSANAERTINLIFETQDISRPTVAALSCANDYEANVQGRCRGNRQKH